MAEKKTFENRLKELGDIVEALEQGDLGLEKSVKQYEKGMKLVQELQSHLQGMEEKIEILTPQGDRESFDADDEEGEE